MTDFLFKKFPSIENYINVADDLDKGYIAHLEIQDRDNWIVTEKIDGSNIGLYISRDDWKIASRNFFIEDDKELNNVLPYARKQLKELIEQSQHMLKEEASDDCEYVILFGEFYGLGIQNRIYYGMDKRFKFFHAVVKMKSGVYSHCPWITLETTFHLFGLEDLLVPVVGRYKTFAEAVKHQNDFVSVLTDDEHRSITEGVVIRPIYAPGFNEFTSSKQVIVKSKNEKFKEQARVGVKKFADDSEYTKMRNEFLTYLTKNRMYSVFSKLGNPTAMKDIGKYMVAYKEDAIADFLKDYPDVLKMEEDEQKAITNIKSQGFLFFKQVIKEMDLRI